MRKRFACIFVSLAVLAALFSGTALAATAKQGAILYAIESGKLEYNVVYSADVANASVTDKTSNGITSISKLTSVMGTPDMPKEVLGTSTTGRTLGKAVTANISFDNSGKVTDIVVTEVRTRPVIGISWEADTVTMDYSKPLERNGALAVFLPQLETASEARDVLSKVDGIFVTGGEDWDPATYDEEVTPHGSNYCNDARDTSDINLMQQAIALDVPMLTVCRGTQGFNIAMGGGLIQDIPYYLGQQVLKGKIDKSRVTRVIPDSGYYLKWNKATQSNDIVYCASADSEDYMVNIDGISHGAPDHCHPIIGNTETTGILSNSKWLYNIIGTSSVDMVVSWHHQSVNPEKLGSGLTIVARTSDGIVEAIEHQGSQFALGLQWHPENAVITALGGEPWFNGTIDPAVSVKLIRSLVTHAASYADDKDDDSSSGCNAGFAGFILVLVAAAPLALRRKK